MYFTDRGIEELEDRRGDEQVTMAWLAERLRDFVDLNPDFEVPVDRLASWLARIDDEEDLLYRTGRGGRGRGMSTVRRDRTPAGIHTRPRCTWGCRRRSASRRTLALARLAICLDSGGMRYIVKVSRLYGKDGWDGALDR